MFESGEIGALPQFERRPLAAFGWALLVPLAACAADDRAMTVTEPVQPSGSAGAGSGSVPAATPASSGAAGASSTLSLPWPPPLRHRLAIGVQHGCVLGRDDSVVCWGEPAAGAAPGIAPPGRFSHLSSKLITACGVREDSTLWCWGDTAANTLPPPSGSFGFLDVGVRVSCGLGLVGGAVSCWGQDSAAAQLPADTYRAVGAGRGFTCGLTVTGALRCGGRIVAPPSDGPFAMLSVGDGNACALRDDRTLACWGLGGPNDPVDGSDEFMVSWGQSIPPPGEFLYVAAGTVHSCALREDGEVVCWGAGRTNGDCLGSGSVDVCGMLLAPPGPFVELSLGFTNSCGLRPDHSVSCWGSNSGNRSTPPAGPL